MSDIISHAMSAGLNRRDAMKLATSGVAASSLSGWLPVLANAETRLTSKAKACIVLWMDGGPSHKDTFDLKPDAPAEFRGEFAPGQTMVPGLKICNLLPKMSYRHCKAAVANWLVFSKPCRNAKDNPS